MSSVKEGCRKAFQAQPQRIMAAMYTCNINVKPQVLGKYMLENVILCFLFSSGLSSKLIIVHVTVR